MQKKRWNFKLIESKSQGVNYTMELFSEVLLGIWSSLDFKIGSIHCSNHLVLFFSPFYMPSRKMLTSNVRDDQGLEKFKKPNKEVRSFFSLCAAGPHYI